MPTARISGSTARPTSPTSKASGRSSISDPATSATRSSRRPSARSACTSAMTGISPRGRGRSEYLWRIEQPSHAVANGYFVGTIKRVGIEAEFGDDDFYGQSYFVDPRGQFVGDIASAHDEELVIRDLDLDKIQEVRNTWQFFRDRRPDAYQDLTRA